jgi:hypothetical protein
MDVYHIWCDLARGVQDVEFCDDVGRYLGRLKQAGQIADYRVLRRKLGLGPSEIGEFHIMIEIEDLAQLDAAFRAVSTRAGPIEVLHHAVNRSARNLRFALYRDFPDADRERGSELF